MKPKYTFVRYRVSRRCFIPGVLAITVATALTSGTARAQTWVPTAAGTYDWGATANWNPTTVPNSTTAVANVNIDIAGAQTINLATGTAANRTINDLNLGDAAGTPGSVITLASGVTNSTLIFGGTNPSLDITGSAVTHTITAPVQLAANTVFRSNINALVSLNGVISNSGTARNMTFNNDINGTATPAGSGLGQFALGAANTAFGTTGTTSISDVRVSAGVANAFGSNAANSVNITGAGQAYLTAGTHINTFNLNSTGWVETAGNLGALRIENATLSGIINLQRDSQIGVNSGTGTISGTIAGLFNMTKIRGAALVLSGTNTYTGLTTVNDGQLRLGSAGALGNSQTVIVENPANPGAADTNTLQLAGGLTFGAGRTVILRNNSTSNISNARTALENQSGNNTWAGNVVLQGGTNQTLAAASGTTLTIAGAVTQASSPSTSLFIRGAGNGILTGSLNIGSAQLYKTDGGTWTFNSTGNTHGSIVIGNGALVANNNNAFNPTSSITLGEGNGNNTTLTINTGFTQALSAVTAAATSTGSHRINGGGALDTGTTSLPVNVADTTAANELTITANLTGTGGITKNGTGNLVLNNTTTGPVVVTGGTLTSSATLGGLSLATGTTLVPGTTTTAGTINTPTLSLTDGTIRVNLGSEGSDLINITNAGGLSQSGTTTIEVSPNGGFNPASTFYPVINHSGSFVGTAGFTAGTMPGRLVGSVTNNGTAIGITATNDRIIWTGASGPSYAWDNSAANDWKKLSDGTPTSFLSQDDVVFNNDGIANNLINLSGTIDPVRVEFAHTSGTYTLNSGTLSGTGNMPLLVTGGGSVVLRTNNTFTGPITISNGSLELNCTAGAPQTSGINIAGGSTFKWSADNITDHNLDRLLSGAGNLIVDANAGGTAGSRQISINQNNSGFTGSITIQPSGNLATNGSMRLAITSQGNIGTGAVTVAERGQLWVNAGVTISNPLTLTGYGFQEGSGGVAAASATGADGSSLTVPTGTYSGNSGIGAVRLNGSAVLSGPITISGDAKIMPYNATATISGDMTKAGANDTFVMGGGGAGSNLWLTGNNSGLGRIWVNGGSSTGTQQLLIGNSTTTGTLGAGDVILYQDAGESRIRIERSDGYTLASGQKILAAHNGTATNLAKARVVINTPGAGVTLNGGTIDLSDGTNGGVLHVAGIAGASGINNARLNIDTSSTVDVGNFNVGDQSGFAGIVNQTGGTVNVINQLRVGHYGNNTSTYNLSAGSLNITATPGAEPSGGGEANGTLYLGVDGTGVMNHSGGTLNTGAVVLDNRTGTGGTDQYNLSGSGILELRNSYGLVGRNNDAVVSLGGGTIRNTGSGVDVSINATTISTSGTTTLDTVSSGNKFSLMSSISGSGTLTTTGGGVIELEPDSNTPKISGSTGTGTQTISAILAGSSAFTKIGSGTTTLSAANTYSGATTVSAGRLNLTGSLANSALTVANTAGLGGEGSASTITLGTNLGDVTNLYVDGSTSGALTSAGAFTVNGPVNNAVKVNLTGFPATSGDITVVEYGSTNAVASNFELVDAAKFRSGVFTVNTTKVTLSFSKKDLTWDGSTTTWETGGTEIDWNDTTDETADDKFFSGDRVTFDDTYITGDQTIAMEANLVPGSITVNNAVNNYTLTGGGIDGSTGIVKSGAANLDLGGTNTFTGGVSISNGILKITTTSALGSTAGGTTVSGTGTLDIGGIATADSLNIQGEQITISGDGVGGGGAIINSSANKQENAFGLVTLAANAAIGGTSRWDIRGAGAVLDLAGNKLTKVGSNLVYGAVDGTITSGDIDVNGGTFAIWNGTVQGTGVLKANPGGTLQLDAMAAGKFTRQVTLNGGTLACTNTTSTGSDIVFTAASSISNTADFNLSGALSETGGPFDLTKTGTGTLILTGTNGLTGKVNVTAGILRVPTDTLLGPATGADAITLQGGGRIMGGNATNGVDFTVPSSKGITLPSGDGGFHVWTGFTMNYGGAITGTGNLTKTDGGILNFTGTAGHTGATTFSLGTTNLDGASITSTSGFRVTGGVTNLNAGTTVTTSGGAEIHTATLNITGGSLSSNRILPSNANNAVSVINQSGGTVTVTGTDSTNTNTASFLFGHYTGGTTTWNMSGGTLNSAGAELSFGWDNPNAFFNQSGGTVNILGLDLANGRNNLAIYNLIGGRLNLGASGITTNGSKLVNLGGGTLGAFADWSTAQAMALTANGGDVTVNTLDSVDNSTARGITMSGVLSGPGGIVKTGAGTLTLSGANTLSGNLTVNGGTLRIGGGNIRSVPVITVNAGAVFQTASTNIFVPDHGTAVAASRKVTVNGGTWTMESGDYRIGNVDLTNGATWTSLPNTDWGILLANNSGGASTVTVGGTGASVMNGAGALRLQGVQNFAVADVTGSTAADLTVSLALRGAGNAGGSAGGVNKTGNGTMVLATGSSHDYDGATTVSQGTLVVNGSLTASGASVSSGATLNGTGSIAGASTVSGTLAPGNSVGTLSFGSTLGLNAGSTYQVEITGAASHDKVAVTGALTANGTISVILDGYTPVAGNSFDIADAASITGTPAFNFAGAALSPGLVWDTSQFLTTGTISVVPDDPYDGWASTNGITGGKFGDHDNDGVLNLLEFATNSDADDASAGANVYAKMHVLGGENVLTLTAAVRKNAVFADGVPDAAKQQATKDRIKYTVEASNDLATWNVVDVAELNPADSTAVRAAFSPALPSLDADWEWHTFRTDGHAAIDPGDFIRLKVEEAP